MILVVTWILKPSAGPGGSRRLLGPPKCLLAGTDLEAGTRLELGESELCLSAHSLQSRPVQVDSKTQILYQC